MKVCGHGELSGAGPGLSVEGCQVLNLRRGVQGLPRFGNNWFSEDLKLSGPEREPEPDGVLPKSRICS